VYVGRNQKLRQQVYINRFFADADSESVLGDNVTTILRGVWGAAEKSMLPGGRSQETIKQNQPCYWRQLPKQAT
jgi:hypothetical protein